MHLDRAMIVIQSTKTKMKKQPAALSVPTTPPTLSTYKSRELRHEGLTLTGSNPLLHS
jgi:hypothetical protein